VTSGFAAEQGGDRRREFRRMLIASGIGHGVLLMGLLVSVPGSRSFVSPSVIHVDLIAPPAASRAARPAAVAKPAPKPVQKQVVLPEKPSLPKPKPAAAKREEVVIEPKVAEDKSLDDLLAEFRAEQGEPAPSEKVAAQPPVAVPGGAGIPVSAEVLAWIHRVKLRVTGAWIVPAGFRRQSLRTEVVVSIDASGIVRGAPRIVRRSGNPWYDEGVVRGIEKASPLPAPPEPGEWTFIFASDESY